MNLHSIHNDGKLNISRVLTVTVNRMCCFNVICFGGFKNVRHILLWIPIDYGEPCALNLDHYLMPILKSVVDLVQVDNKLFRFIGCKWRWFFKTLPEPSS